MTDNNTRPVSFGKFFIMFWKYWDYTSKSGTDYNAFEVVLLTNVLFMDLRTQWKKKKKHFGCGRVKVELGRFRS